MSTSRSEQTVLSAISVLERWAGAIEARAARRIRRSQLVDIQQEALAQLASLRFQAPSNSDFRSLMSNVALIASRETRDSIVEQWLRSTIVFLTKQVRARDPLNWRGESRSELYGLELALPRKEWPYAFNDR